MIANATKKLVETRMLDVHDPATARRAASEYVGDDPAVLQAAEGAVKERKAADDHAFANKLAKRLPPDEVEHAAIEKARRRTKARATRIAMHIEDT
jgi:hypothetical protein